MSGLRSRIGGFPTSSRTSQLSAVATAIFSSSTKYHLKSHLPVTRCSQLFHCWSRTPAACARFKLNVDKRQQITALAEVVTDDSSEGQSTAEEGYMKSHPYRQISRCWQSKSVLAKTLVENTIHNDNGLFVTNKPFGVGVRQPDAKQKQRGNLHTRGLPSCPYTLQELVPELRYLLNKPNLVLVRSTEKFTSGIAVFADDEATAERFSKCVASSKMYFDTLYKYHVVTVLPPFLIGNPSTTHRYGITVKKVVGSDVGTPVLLHEYSRNSVKRRDVVSVHCQTKILQFGGNADSGCLVEMNTSSTKHNFLRIHCADKLAPILGDQLYSSRVETIKGLPAKIDPTHLTPGTGFQKITENMQHCLNLRQPGDILIVPTHAHLRSYMVRKFLLQDKSAVMQFEAPYPHYFKWTCDQLGILLPTDLSPVIKQQ